MIPNHCNTETVFHSFLKIFKIVFSNAGKYTRVNVNKIKSNDSCTGLNLLPIRRFITLSKIIRIKKNAIIYLITSQTLRPLAKVLNFHQYFLMNLSISEFNKLFSNHNTYFTAK